MNNAARIALAFAAALLASCGEDSCNTGTCRFGNNLTACVTAQAYDRLTDEFAYIKRTRDTTRIGYLYSTGLCKRFPKGTRVHILESGIFKVKIRFADRPGSRDMWINPEFLERVRFSSPSEQRPAPRRRNRR